MENGVFGALNDYLGREVQVTVRSEADGAYNSLKLELYGKLVRAHEGFALAAADGTTIARLIVDASAAELLHWQDPAADQFADDWIGFSVGGISLTVGS